MAANYDKKQPGLCTVNVPFEEAFTEEYATYRVTDLLTNVVVVEGTKDEIAQFHGVIPYDTCGIYLVEGTK